MYRQSYQHNMYGQGSPGHGGEQGFRSPMPRPRYQSSPRFHQPGVHSYGGPGRPGPGPGSEHAHGGGPPGRSPPYRSPRDDFSFNSPMHGSFDGGSPYHGRGGWGGRGRGRVNILENILRANN